MSKIGRPIKREELYELIWSMSAVKVAKRYGLSYRALEEICRQMEIPMPKIGVPRNKDKRAPLADLSPSGKSEFTYSKPLPALPTESTNLKKAGSHEPNHKPWIEGDLTARVDPSVEGRARKVLAGLMSAVESCGLAVKVSAKGIPEVRVDTETMILEMYSRPARYNPESKPLLLVLQLNGTWAERARSVRPPARFRSYWLDTNAEPLESRIEVITDTIASAHRYLKRHREENEAHEKAQAIRNAAFQVQNDFMKRLETQALSWERAQRIRGYLEAVEVAVKNGSLKPDKHFENWLIRSYELAASLDPITGTWSVEPPDYTDLERRCPKWGEAESSTVPWWSIKKI